MRRTSLIAILLVLLFSLFLLSVLSNILTGYPVQPRPPKTDDERTGKASEKEPPVTLFRVSPVTPQLYWRVFTADYYTGKNWLKTTDENVLTEFPQFQEDNLTKVFAVEINLLQHETFLPLPPPVSALANISFASTEGLEFYRDAVGDVYKVVKRGQTKGFQLVYEVKWHDFEVDDRLISLDDAPEEILNKYLQLPDISIDVWTLAKDLEDPSYSILDQVLADVQYLRTNFVYDEKHPQFLYEGVTQGSDVSSYIQRGRGLCLDAATALAVILRVQEIPARISIGYKPSGRIEGGKLLYYTTGAHSVTEVYLPPYGWIQFDATPPLEENPLVKVSPFKKEGSPGSNLFYTLSVTNRHNLTDNFKLFVDSKQEWNIEAAPKQLRIELLQTADALLKVTIPNDESLGQKDVVTVTIASLDHPEVAFSILTITQVANVSHIPTTTTLRGIDEAVIRGDTLWVNGTVLTASDKKVDNMTVFIFLTKNKEAEGIIVGKGYSIEGNFQTECAVPYFMEIGDYKVIPISLGTTHYAPSSTDFIIRVCATTRMELGFEEEFLLGYGAIHGQLLWDNGTGFADAPILLNISLLAMPLENWRFQNLTSKDGLFRIETTFENPGVYKVKAMFSGDEYVLGNNATRVVELKRGLYSEQSILGC